MTNGRRTIYVVVKCYMIAYMIPEFARKYESYRYAEDIKAHLDYMNAENISAVSFATTKELMTLRLHEGASVHEYCLKIMMLFQKLTNLDVVLCVELSLDIILLSLPSSFELVLLKLSS